MNLFCKKENKKIIMFLVIIIMFVQTFSLYAKTKGKEPMFPNKPSADERELDGHSEGVIYSPMMGMTVKNPLNPTPSIINEKEKKEYDTYVIDINTMPKRIEYFSPTYTSILSNAQSSIIGALGAAGVSAESSVELKRAEEEAVRSKRALDRQIDLANSNLKKLQSLGYDDTNPEVQKIKGEIAKASIYKATTEAGIAASKKGRFTMNNMLSKVTRASDVARLDKYRDSIAKGLITGYLQFKQLESNEQLLKQLVDLNKRKYDLITKNVSIGLATEIEKDKAKVDYDEAVDQYNTIKTLRDGTEEQILLNLGYKVEDKYKITYVEPEVDEALILAINPNNDYEHAVYSNQEYLNAQSEVQNSKKKFDDYVKNIYDNYKNENRQKVISEVDEMYAKLMAEYRKYEGSKYLKEAYNLDAKSAEMKKKEGLVSDIEYIGLQVQNLSNKVSVIAAKYNLLIAYYNYNYMINGV